MQLLAANQLPNKKRGDLCKSVRQSTYFLVLFLAALAAGCQQGSWVFFSFVFFFSPQRRYNAPEVAHKHARNR